MTCHVTGAGVEYDPKQQATAEFLDNMSIHYCIASMLNIQSLVDFTSISIVPVS